MFWKHLILAAALPVLVSSNTANPNPWTDKQPDGTEVTLMLRGNEYFHEVVDMNEYTVVQNEKNEYVYADTDEEGFLVPTHLQVGKVDPVSEHLPKHVQGKPKPPANDRRLRGSGGEELVHIRDHRHLEPSTTATSGTLRNFVLLLRFKNHRNRNLPTRQNIWNLMNQETAGGLAPTGSLKSLYREFSYNQLTVDSTVTNWIDLPEDESYYAAGQSGLTTRIHEAIRTGLQLADGQYDMSQFDVDGDGMADAFTIVHSGYAAEFGGTDAFGTPRASRIWSHKWAIPTWISNEGIRFSTYNINPSLWSTSGSAIGRIGVIAHEFGHFLGLPDYYDTDSQTSGVPGSGIGSYGLMANSWGFDGSQYYPPHPCAYNKMQLGWLQPQEATAGLNQISLLELPQQNSPQALMITEGFPSGEFLLIENRQPVGSDSRMPQGGLAVFHIDENSDINSQGWPGQSGWPSNGNHYRLALLQADGDYDLERNVNRGDGGDVFHAGGVRSIGPSTGSNGPYPNTDRYQNGNIQSSGITIRDIGAAANTMTFVCDGCSGSGGGATCPPGQRPFRLELLTDNYGSETSWTLAAPDGSLVADGSGYSSNTAYTETACLSQNPNTCYTLTINDSYGDGICCSYGSGSYEVFVDDVLIASGGSFGSQEVVSIGSNCGEEESATTSTTSTTTTTSSTTTTTTSTTTTTPSTTTTTTSTTTTSSGACPSGQELLQVDILTDLYPMETSWTVVDSSNNTVAQAGGFTKDDASTLLSSDTCLDANECYTFTIRDSYGDGISGPHGNGEYDVAFGSDAVVSNGGAFSWEESTEFGNCSPPDNNGDCADDQLFFRFILTTDNYGEETSWQLRADGTLVWEEPENRPNVDVFEDATTYISQGCLQASSCWTVQVFDSFGDGTCCSYGEGSFEAQVNGETIATGGEFGASSEIISFGNCGSRRDLMVQDISDIGEPVRLSTSSSPANIAMPPQPASGAETTPKPPKKRGGDGHAKPEKNHNRQ